MATREPHLEEVELNEFVGSERGSDSRIYNVPTTIMSMR